jgi:hypothetical protein
VFLPGSFGIALIAEFAWFTASVPFTPIVVSRAELGGAALERR